MLNRTSQIPEQPAAESMQPCIEVRRRALALMGETVRSGRVNLQVRQKTAISPLKATKLVLRFGFVLLFGLLPETGLGQASDEKPVAVQSGQRIDLLDGDFSKRWQCFASTKGKAGQTWRLVRSGSSKELHCSGQPKGFLITAEQYSNFELTFEWMYPADANGNSGVLIYTRNEPRLWPTSMQVQLHRPQAGALFATGNATSDKPFEPGLVAGKAGEWNKCRIVSQDGQLSVEINGQKAGQTEGCSPAVGHIALQSEGSVTIFRKLFLTKLPPKPAEEDSPKENKEASAGDAAPKSVEADGVSNLNASLQHSGTALPASPAERTNNEDTGGMG